VAGGWINIDNFRNEDGTHDWDAHEKAQIAHGDICYSCKAFILFPNGRATKCNSCLALTTSRVEVTHDRFVRCPKCGKTWKPDWCDDGDLYEEGEHEICCGECDATFTVTTHVSFTFCSPGLAAEPEEKEEEDAVADLEDSGPCF
jgi:hypothetical protein